MMHFGVHAGDMVMGRSPITVKHTVKHVGDGGSIVGEWLRASICGRVLGFERQLDHVFERVLTVETAISASPDMKKFIPNICHLSQFSAYFCATISLLKFFTMEGMIV